MKTKELCLRCGRRKTNLNRCHHCSYQDDVQEVQQQQQQQQQQQHHHQRRHQEEARQQQHQQQDESVVIHIRLCAECGKVFQIPPGHECIIPDFFLCEKCGRVKLEFPSDHVCETDQCHKCGKMYYTLHDPCGKSEYYPL